MPSFMFYRQRIGPILILYCFTCSAISDTACSIVVISIRYLIHGIRGRSASFSCDQIHCTRDIPHIALSVQTPGKTNTLRFATLVHFRNMQSSSLHSSPSHHRNDMKWCPFHHIADMQHGLGLWALAETPCPSRADRPQQGHQSDCQCRL